jgi:hypothetical protein
MCTFKHPFPQYFRIPSVQFYRLSSMVKEEVEQNQKFKYYEEVENQMKPNNFPVSTYVIKTTNP